VTVVCRLGFLTAFGTAAIYASAAFT